MKRILMVAFICSVLGVSSGAQVVFVNGSPWYTQPAFFSAGLRILEGGTSPVYTTTFVGGDQSANLTYTLPTADAAGALNSNGSGSLSWAAPAPAAHNLLSAYHGDTTTASVARGAIVTGQGASAKWAALAKGTAGYLLGMGTDEPVWTNTVPEEINGGFGGPWWKLGNSIADMATIGEQRWATKLKMSGGMKDALAASFVETALSFWMTGRYGITLPIAPGAEKALLAYSRTSETRNAIDGGTSAADISWRLEWTHDIGAIVTSGYNLLPFSGRNPVGYLTGWSGPGWSSGAELGSDGAYYNPLSHSPGSSDSLTPDPALSILPGHRYKFSGTISGRTAGTLTPSVGGATGDAISADGAVTQYLTATTAANFALAPQSAFNGKVILPSLSDMDHIRIENTTASTAAKPTHDSPSLVWEGHAWDTDGATDDRHEWRAMIVTTSGDSTTSTWRLTKQVNGAGEVTPLAVGSDGSISVASGLLTVDAGGNLTSNSISTFTVTSSSGVEMNSGSGESRAEVNGDPGCDFVLVAGGGGSSANQDGGAGGGYNMSGGEGGYGGHEGVSGNGGAGGAYSMTSGTGGKAMGSGSGGVGGEFSLSAGDGGTSDSGVPGDGGTILIHSGKPGGAGAYAGDVAIDSGDVFGGGTAGTISIGGANASEIYLAGGYGNTGVTISQSGGDIDADGSVQADGGFAVGVDAGLTTVVTVRDAGGGADCTLTFSGGILTATTCRTP